MKPAAVAAVLADPLARALLDGPLARLAYDGTDGRPRVVPVGFWWTGGAVVVCTASVAPKVAALRADPHVALTVDTDTQPPKVLLIRGTADVEIVPGVPEEFLAASHKYIGDQGWAEFEQTARSLYPDMARIVVTPTWAKLLDFETRLPEAVHRLAARPD